MDAKILDSAALKFSGYIIVINGAKVLQLESLNGIMYDTMYTFRTNVNLIIYNE